MSIPEDRSPSEPEKSSSGHPGFVPLSEQLLQIIHTPHGASMTLNQLLSQTSDRGPYALIILLCLPFMTPVSLPGVSNVFGVVIMLLGWKIMHGQPPLLPHRIGERSIEGKYLAPVIRASIRVLRWVEKITRPRGAIWIRSPQARRFNAAVLIYGGAVLAAPFPPLIPMSNLAPAVGILLVAAAMMEEDAVVLWLGHAATVAATVYIGTLVLIQYALIVKLWHRYSDPILEFIRGFFA